MSRTNNTNSDAGRSPKTTSGTRELYIQAASAGLTAVPLVLLTIAAAALATVTPQPIAVAAIAVAVAMFLPIMLTVVRGFLLLQSAMARTLVAALRPRPAAAELLKG